MKFTSTVLAFAAAVSAADLQHYSQTNCGGGYSQCGNVGSGVCCATADQFNGAQSLGLVWVNPGSQLFGYQRTRNGDNCGAIVNQIGTGQYSFVCLSFPGGPGSGAYAASRWYPAGLKRDADMCPATSTEACSGIVEADTIVLDDGHAFDLLEADEDSKTQLYNALSEGKTTEDLPEPILALEKDTAGVENRLAEMAARRR